MGTYCIVFMLMMYFSMEAMNNHSVQTSTAYQTQKDIIQGLDLAAARDAFKRVSIPATARFCADQTAQSYIDEFLNITQEDPVKKKTVLELMREKHAKNVWYIIARAKIKNSDGTERVEYYDADALNQLIMGSYFAVPSLEMIKKHSLSSIEYYVLPHEGRSTFRFMFAYDDLLDTHPKEGTDVTDAEFLKTILRANQTENRRLQANAQQKLIDIYQTSDKFKDEHQAFLLSQMVASREDSQHFATGGKLRVAQMYHAGIGTPQDYIAAAERYKQLSGQKDHPSAAAIACYNLGLMYMRGEGVVQQSDEGFRYMRLAAQQQYNRDIAQNAQTFLEQCTRLCE